MPHHRPVPRPHAQAQVRVAVRPASDRRDLLPTLLAASLVLLLTVAALMFTRSAWAQDGYPEPQAVSTDWQLTFVHEDPRVIRVTTPGGETQYWWYIKYAVTNHTRAERSFFPQATVVTDMGTTHEINTLLPNYVFNAIKAQQRNNLLMHPLDVTGSIRTGTAATKESVLAWPMDDQDIAEFNVMVMGLSGETAEVTHPLTGETVLVRRTLQLTYLAPGVHDNPLDTVVADAGEDWVMR